MSRRRSMRTHIVLFSGAVFVVALTLGVMPAWTALGNEWDGIDDGVVQRGSDVSERVLSMLREDRGLLPKEELLWLCSSRGRPAVVTFVTPGRIVFYIVSGGEYRCDASAAWADIESIDVFKQFGEATQLEICLRDGSSFYPMIPEPDDAVTVSFLTDLRSLWLGGK